MLKGQDLICISTIDWDFIWQGHQEIMSTLAKNGNRILFIENTGIRSPIFRDIPRITKRIRNWFKSIKGFRREGENLYIFSPLILPFPYSRIAGWVNGYLMLKTLKNWMGVMRFDNPIIWTFLPTGITLDIINNINERLVIYYCIDNFSASSVSARKIIITEKKLLKRADLVFVTSQALRDYCSKNNKHVNIFPFGVNIDNFEKALHADNALPNELKDIKKPIVGYIGGIHKWIDFDMAKSLARNYPEYSFVYIGPVQTDISIFSDVKNVYFLGNKKHTELPYLVKEFDVCVIPYLIKDYTKNVYPTKLNEYLALGKPVVSTGLPEVIMFNEKNNNIVYIAENIVEFGEAIKRSIKEDNQMLRNRRIDIAKNNSWKNRIEDMCNLIEVALEKKMMDKKEMWKESFAAFYKTARNRIVKIVAVSVVLYLIVFYTPLFWFLAKPLKMESALERADAIVVFAGGVGESGKAGQGYEERVGYAVDLYKRGFSSNIIFSSGTRSTFSEPYVMKALTISFGVPTDNIILDDMAKNTYENVKFTDRILNEKKWNKIILISSPYHMQRAAMIFRRVDSSKTVIYSPVPNSQFFVHGGFSEKGRKVWKQISLRQIRAILHEYMAICYYWWKGYI